MAVHWWHVLVQNSISNCRLVELVYNTQLNFVLDAITTMKVTCMLLYTYFYTLYTSITLINTALRLKEWLSLFVYCMTQRMQCAITATIVSIIVLLLIGIIVCLIAAFRTETSGRSSTAIINKLSVTYMFTVISK